MSERWAGIYFYLNGENHAFRSWKSVPRVGETVVFSSTDKPLYVTRVLWREKKGTDEPYAEVELTDQKSET